MRSVLISLLLILFALPLTASETGEVSARCDELKKRFSDIRPDKTLLCLSSGDVDVSVVGDFDIAVLLEPSKLNLSTEQIEVLFPPKQRDVLIDGICTRVCSRLILPLAREAEFTQDSFAVLTDVSSEHYTQLPISLNDKKVFIELNEQPRTGSALRMRSEIQRPSLYRNSFAAMQARLADESRLLAKAEVNLSHLLWHGFVKDMIHYDDNLSCRPLNNLAVALTPQYLRANAINVTGNFKLPYKKELVARIQDELGPTLVLYTYDMRPLNDCPF